MMHGITELIALTVIGTIIIFLYLYARHWIRRAKWAEHEAATWKALVDQRANTANNFYQACRLISIHRQDRMNLFTFARGDEMFTIETVGMLSDDPDEWRRLAGLTDAGK
jgi:ABC-type multidrug transport system fused ATPase/permease subunit